MTHDTFTSPNPAHFCNKHSVIFRDFNSLDESDKSSGCKLILRFRSPVTLYEKFVSKVVGSPVHVDMVFHQPGTDGMRFSYSAFLGEKFSITLMPDEITCSELYENIVVAISDREHARCVSYVNKLIDKASYNYNDAMMWMPMFQGHPTFASVMCDDIDSDDPSEIKKIYCSQAVILVLRECLSAGNPFELMVEGANSRMVSPSALHQMVCTCKMKKYNSVANIS
jgi:hypothetical protein